jgi:hypothetical protein
MDPSAENNTRHRCVIAFNSFWSAFLQDLQGINEDIKTTVQKNYKVVNKTSSEYVLSFDLQFENKDFSKIIEHYASDECKKIEIYKGLTVENVLEYLKKEDREEDENIVWNHVYSLLLFLHLYKTNDSSLFDGAMDVLSKLQHQINKNEISDEINSIIEESTHILLSYLLKTTCPVPVHQNINVPQIEENGLICSLAKEISEEIDVSNLPTIENPQDILKCMDFSGSNNVIGDILQKVSSKIHQKLSSGQLKQEQLLAEAMKMMSTLSAAGGGGGGGSNPSDLMSSLMSGNNPLMAEALKAMGRGSGGSSSSVRNRIRHESRNAMTKERLRAKLAQRRQTDT